MARLVALVLTALLVACTSSGTKPSSRLSVTSAAFKEGTALPADNTCKGAGTFPGLSWTSVSGATGFAIVVADPDAPNGTYFHLVVPNVPASTTKLDAADLDTVATSLNSNGATGWTPPCPPSGTHHYRFTVYALKAKPTITDATEPAGAQTAIKAVALVQATLTGLVAA